MHKLKLPSFSLSCYGTLCTQSIPSRRLHVSCLFCTTRKAQYNSKYQYDSFFKMYLPAHFDCLTSILNNGTGYILFYDEKRMFARFKHPLLLWVFARAERTRFTKIAKRLYLLAEILAI